MQLLRDLVYGEGDVDNIADIKCLTLAQVNGVVNP